MAKFFPAFERTLVHEGGWVHDPQDPGGETFYGISRKHHPNWAGWKAVDTLKELGKLHDPLSPSMKSALENFYDAEFWIPLCLDRFPSVYQELAEQVFDFAVNAGKHRAGMTLQNCVNHFAEGDLLKVDGIIGPKTIWELTEILPQLLVVEYKRRRIAYYKSLNKPRFEAGWIRRVG